MLYQPCNSTCLTCGSSVASHTITSELVPVIRAFPTILTGAACTFVHTCNKKNEEVNQFSVLKTEEKKKEKSDSGTKWGSSAVSFLEQRSDSVWCWTRANSRRTVDTLVFSTTGGMGPSALIFYRRLAHLLGERCNTPFNVIMSWMRTRLSFALLRASIMCLRGSRVRRTVPWNDLPAEVVVCEGRLDRS